jgi:tetratricopeptide (TPR) repeat protein
MDEEQRIQRTNSDNINRLFHEEKWEDARLFILQLLENVPNDHFLLSQLAATYYEQKDYQQALVILEQALMVTPRCPLVLYYYAGALDMLNRHEDAINVYKGLLRRGVRNIASGECRQEIREARSLVNDCRYRLGLIYADLGEFQIAKNYLNAHIIHRDQNCPSGYYLREVKKDLADIRAGNNPRGI